MSGLLIGGIYALMAVSLSLIFGLMNTVNLVPGDYLMLAHWSPRAGRNYLYYISEPELRESCSLFPNSYSGKFHLLCAVGK
jgi:hypothetical protein